MLPLIAARWPYLQVCDFGHRGDGGDHFNIVWPKNAATAYDPAVVEELRRCVYDEVVHRHHGSFSAEHGIGPFNQEFYHRYTTEAVVNLSGALKELLDARRLLGNVKFGPAR
jgi:FAD/FMN-containing dehydrogenase